MAISVKANQLSRKDTHVMDPFSIIMLDENRGRKIPPTDEEVIDRALSMLQYGQIEPVECRKDETTKAPILDSGFTRVAAARLIRDGFHDSEGNFHKDENFTIWVAFTRCNEEQAFTRNIVENAHRNETSPIDDAHNQERLRTRYNKTDAEIASVYQYRDVQKVYRLKKLLALDFDTQKLVHYGQLAVSAALDLLEMPEAERAAAIEQAKNGDGKVNSGLIREAVRNRILSDDLPENVTLADNVAGISNGSGEGTLDTDVPENLVLGDPTPGEEAPVKGKARSMREVKKFWEAQMEAAQEAEDAAMERFSKDLLDFIAGKKTDKQMVNAIARLRQ